MTIDRIKLSIQTVKDNIAIMESEDITQDNIDAGYYLQLEHEKFVLESLEKRLPKSVIRHGFDTNKLISTVSYTCPVCKSHISRTEYCPNCGQALDWRDTE